MLKRLVLASLAFFPVLPAFAASDDAWAEFASEVENSCLEATTGMLENAEVTVDPFGSQSYGLAIVSGEVGEGQTAALVCVFDKQSKAVEVGGELSVTVTPKS